MTDAGKMIDAIIAAIENAIPNTDEKIYRDEPIIMTAARKESLLPEKYRECRRIGRDDPSMLANEARLFVAQAKFMEDFEDDFPYGGEYMKYFPTYRSMNDRQIRGYFTWRAAVRRGEVRETSLSFAYVYLYELINAVGAATPAEAAAKFDSFVIEYSKIDRSILRLAKRWRHDVSVYYALDDERSVDGLSAAAGIVARCRETDDDGLWRAIAAASSFDPEKSKLTKAHPNEVKTLVCRTLRSFFDYCEKNRKTPPDERIFGKRCERAYVIFPSAVFFDAHRAEPYEYTAPDGTVYRRRGGIWSRTGYPEIKKKSALLGAVIRTIDSTLRPLFGVDGAAEAESRLIARLAKAEYDIFAKETKEAERRRVKFDFTKLDGIRSSAEATSLRLVTEEELDFDEDSHDDMETATDERAPSPLTDDERETLRLIIDGGDAASFAKSRGAMLSVIVDSINEKLFDTLLDTAIEFDGDAPRPVDDYISDLKGFAAL